MTSNPYRLAKCLARPVARGWLSHEDAEDCLLAEVLAARRRGTLGPYDPVTVYGGLRWILAQYLAAEEARRDLAAVRIRYRLKPLLAVRKPPNALLAEAHDVNGAAGFPLTEREITDCVAAEVYRSLPAGGARHAR